tara:strand:+ start:168 stop:611 length:444 start_codon:yes stop_codon:yes gene_type:complete
VNRLAHFIASICYIGYFPIASGTFASFVALLIWWFFVTNIYLQLVIIALTIFLGTYASYLTEKLYNSKDPSFIVVDEFAGMFISLFLVPKNIYLYIFAFILFRVLDVIKPSYIDTVQKYKYGIGVMADDILAGILSCMAVHLFLFLV